MALNINAQYTKFVQFAEQQMQTGKETAIARDGGEEPVIRDLKIGQALE